MRQFTKKVSITALAAAATGAGITWIYGSDNVPHDTEAASVIKGPIKWGNWCADPSELLNAKPGDVVIPMRANSVDCRYKSEMFDSIALCGWDNSVRFVGNDPIENCITMGNGNNYGRSVEFCIPGMDTSNGFPRLANIIHNLNSATSTPMTIGTLRRVLSDSSDENCTRNGVYAGEKIYEPRALELVIGNPGKPSPYAWLPAVYRILESAE